MRQLSFLLRPGPPPARRGMCEGGTFAGPPFAFYQGTRRPSPPGAPFPYRSNTKNHPTGWFPATLTAVVLPFAPRPAPPQGGGCVKGGPLRVLPSRFIRAPAVPPRPAFRSPHQLQYKKPPDWVVSCIGADDQIRTDYLVLTKDALYLLSYISKIGRGRRIRTLGTWFWRPLLYQLSYTPISRFEGVSIQCQQTRLYTKVCPLSTTLSLFFHFWFAKSSLPGQPPPAGSMAGNVRPPAIPLFCKFSPPSS